MCFPGLCGTMIVHRLSLSLGSRLSMALGSSAFLTLEAVC